MGALPYSRLVADHFRLEGEDVIRASTGRVVKFTPNKHGYGYVAVPKAFRPTRTLKYHRLKFCLAYGWLPPEVDHKSRDKLDNSKANLRAATRGQNSINRAHRKKSGLPRCVTLTASGKYRAATKLSGQRFCLGTFSTLAEAATVVEAFRRKYHGEFYANP